MCQTVGAPWSSRCSVTSSAPPTWSILTTDRPAPSIALYDDDRQVWRNGTQRGDRAVHGSNGDNALDALEDQVVDGLADGI